MVKSVEVGKMGLDEYREFVIEHEANCRIRSRLSCGDVNVVVVVSSSGVDARAGNRTCLETGTRLATSSRCHNNNKATISQQ
jgi:hypothetical protein